MEASERIEALRRYTGMNYVEMAKKMDIKRSQTFTDIRKGKNQISRQLALKVVAAFPEIRHEWIMFGEGSMTKQEAANNVPLYESRIQDTNRLGVINVGSCFPGAEAVLRNDSNAMIEYPKGAMLVLRKVLDNLLLVPGKDYVVSTVEFTAVKRVQRGSDGLHVSLYSTGADRYPDGKLVYEPFDVPISSVEAFYDILGYIYTNVSGLIAKE